MFTSRAEYRLLLRQDNADLRLSRLGHEIGLLQTRNFKKFAAKEVAIADEINRLCTTYSQRDSLAKILSRTEISYQDLPSKNTDLDTEVLQQVEIAIKYAGYVDRQKIDVARTKNLEDKIIPNSFDFSTVPSLRLEARQKLDKIRPRTIGQAGRISGVSPADISILLIWLKRGTRNSSEISECVSLLNPNEDL
jgi:tRNA uridine 5-carboxymethylaminomethyl modification enzyme